MTEIKLDEWKPEAKGRPSLVPSKWREESINGNFNQEPGLSDLRKIKFAIKRKYPDHEVMQAFGLNAETLVSIKTESYSAAEGLRHFYPKDIVIGKELKMNLELQKLEDVVKGILAAVDYMGDVLFIDKKQRKEFKDVLTGKKYYSSKLFTKPGIKKKELSEEDTEI